MAEFEKKLTLLEETHHHHKVLAELKVHIFLTSIQIAGGKTDQFQTKNQQQQQQKKAIPETGYAPLYI
jgi:hypothetical protein